MPDSEVTNIILRFRDLVTTKGGTILSHADIAKEAGYVWWAWWHKPTEKIADTVFRELKAKAVGDGLEVLLLDSGRRLLFKAHCTDVLYDALHQDIKSPEPEKTPQYYRDTPYKVWFKFAAMDDAPIDAELLKSFTYVKVDDFFEDGASKFTPFYGKQVRSVQELTQQDRTIWFVRPYASGDATHEIALLDVQKIRPAHFPDQFTQVPSSNILWVSDLHFSAHEHHNYPLEANAVTQPLSIRLDQAIKGQGVRDLAGVLISGDVTYMADPSEYDMALDFVHDLLHLWNLSNYHVAVIPGNHDIRFSADPAAKGEMIGAAPPQAREAYTRFYESLFYLAPNDTMSSSRRFLLKGGLAVEIANLNSQLLDQMSGAFQGQGFIGETQLREVAENMGWNNDAALSADQARPFRIVMVHHHILPVTFREKPFANAQYSVLLDAEALARWVVEHKVNLVLHGHMHQPFATRLTRPRDLSQTPTVEHSFHVVGMGSTGIKLADVGEVSANTFGVIDFSKKNEVVIKVFTVDPVTPSRPIFQVVVPY